MPRWTTHHNSCIHSLPRYTARSCSGMNYTCCSRFCRWRMYHLWMPENVFAPEKGHRRWCFPTPEQVIVNGQSTPGTATRSGRADTSLTDGKAPDGPGVGIDRSGHGHVTAGVPLDILVGKIPGTVSCKRDLPASERGGDKMQIGSRGQQRFLEGS